MASKLHSGNMTPPQPPATQIPLTPTVETVRMVASEVKEAPDKNKCPGGCVFRVIVPALKAESIFGRNGKQLINKICEETKTNIRLLKSRVCDSIRIVKIYCKEDIEAPLSHAMDAVIRLFKHVNGFPENESDGGVASTPFCSIRLLLTSVQAMTLVGKQGSLIIKTIQENTGCFIRILSCDEVSKLSSNSDDIVVNLKGEGLKVLQALEAVLRHMCMFLVDHSHSILPLIEETDKTVPVVLNTTEPARRCKKRRLPALPLPPVAAKIPPEPQKKRMVCSSLVEVSPKLPQVQHASELVAIETKAEEPTESPEVQPESALKTTETRTEGPVSVDDPNTVDQDLTRPTPDRLHLYKDLSPSSHLCNSHCPSSGMESIKEPKRSRYYWNDNIVKTFLDACIHEATTNGHEGGSLKAMSWKKVGEILKARHNFPVDSKQMKTYFDGLKSKYIAWLSLKNNTGNVYDPSTNMFNLTDEEWETEMKKNKCIETLRKAPLRFPDRCAQLFDGSISTYISQIVVDQALTELEPSPPTLPASYVASPSELPLLPATETPAQPQNEPMGESPSELHQVQPASELVAIETKQSMSVYEEEILGMLKMIAEKIKKPEQPLKPTFEDCEKKLNELGWANDDPLHLAALTIFCDENNHYRELWINLNPKSCVDWVRMIGRSKRLI